MNFKIKKIIPYCFILLILVGLFSAGREVGAIDLYADFKACVENINQKGTAADKLKAVETCNNQNNPKTTFSLTEPPPPPTTNPEYQTCVGNYTARGMSQADAEKKCAEANNTTTSVSGSAFENNISSCELLIGDFDDCLVKLIYYIFYVIPAFLLNLIANFFNVIIALALSSVMYTADFIAESWRVVRDLSNIFFILILLYIAVKVILGLGGQDVKKMIVHVILMAFLINFSMFFTKVIIDTTNVLALIFYNKINVTTVLTKDGTTNTRVAMPILDGNKTGGVQDKDISGGLVSKFDPTKFLTEDFFKKVKERAQVVPTALGAGAYIGSGALIGSFIPVVGTGVGAVIGGITYGLSFLGSPEVPPGLMIGIIITAGLIMMFAIYAFFMASISFLGRLVELWVLIIFSPFAFMSWSNDSLLGKVPYIGWEEWSKKILKISFMAPIFMFFMYLIFKLVNTNIWSGISIRDPKDQGMIEAMILVILPALIILVLLLQATKFAKEGSGKLGEAVLSGAKLVGGLALGAATGGTAVLARATVGRAGAAIATSATAKRWEAEGKFGAGIFRSGAKALGAGSFDIRGVKIAGKDLGSATGMSVGKAQEGGFEKRKAEQVKKRQERAKELEVGEDETLKQSLNTVERDLQDLLRTNSHQLDQIDKRIKTQRERASDASRRARTNGAGVVNTATGLTYGQEAINAENTLADSVGERGAIKNATTFTTSTGTVIDHSLNRVGGVAGGASINQLEDTIIPNAHHHIETENRRRKWNYANTAESGFEQTKNFVFSGGQHSFAGAKEAAHKIRMEAKLDSGEKGGH